MSGWLTRRGTILTAPLMLGVASRMMRRPSSKWWLSKRTQPGRHTQPRPAPEVARKERPRGGVGHGGAGVATRTACALGDSRRSGQAGTPWATLVRPEGEPSNGEEADKNSQDHRARRPSSHYRSRQSWPDARGPLDDFAPPYPASEAEPDALDMHLRHNAMAEGSGVGAEPVGA